MPIYHDAFLTISRTNCVNWAGLPVNLHGGPACPRPRQNARRAGDPARAGAGLSTGLLGGTLYFLAVNHLFLLGSRVYVFKSCLRKKV